MRSKVLQRIVDKTPKDVVLFVDKYADLVLRINQILSEKGYTQKSLAEKMEKRPSEIHKWLSGDHNFTLRSIAKLEAELGEILLEVPVRKPITEFQSPAPARNEIGSSQSPSRSSNKGHNKISEL